MNRTVAAIKEWINPAWARHRTVPPMEAGLRPNSRLDESRVLLPDGAYEPDDVVPAWGALVFSSGNRVCALRDGQVRTVAELDGAVGSLTAVGEAVVAAVEGTGLVALDESGSAEELCTDDAVSSCVTDIAALPDGSLLLTVGSSQERADGWARALVRGDRSGRIVRVDGAAARVEAEGLAWPSGIEPAPGGDVLVSVSLDHRIERRAVASLSGPARPFVANLPVYPGRLVAAGDGWWAAAPYVRNRITELLLDEPEVLADMTATVAPRDWFVPRLRSTNPYTDTPQMGQLRVLGVLKPWAPARSYGLVFRMDAGGRVAESLQSRVDGERHGVTGVAVRGGELVVAARGYRNLLAVDDEE
ncbi:hypothetical protein [Amycolatopsis thermophila]|uniref:Strictosidine synthase n=1 Tax=Amycolatopsis thermophila TaxID=206084 RepID=A0ABU0F5B8_9PSEU|nr:hypothetical protein [Amycolatopsis thermophila]MDQ0382524.1 hypothetical protein [Amycolatopsis thermophila]